MDRSLPTQHHASPPLARRGSLISRHKRVRSTESTGNSSFSQIFSKALNPAHHLRHRIVKKAAGVVDQYVSDLTNKSPYLLSCDASNGFEGESETACTVPLLERSQIRVGKLLGEGGFCTVYEVVGINAKGDGDAAELAFDSSSLALKQLRKRLTKNPPQFTLATADLVVEAQYLSRLCHPHIVPVRGMTKDGVNAMTVSGRFDSYFLVIDRLETTLDQRITAWQRGQELAPTYDQKLTWAIQIAQALEYLHQRRILFRDVKPHNIGFRADTGVLQLFDFGLCRELPPPKEKQPQDTDSVGDLLDDDDSQASDESEEDLDDYYLMTKVGTRRYCAVEMYISGRYNEKVDVYSWAMTVYEMISLTKPFSSLTDTDHQEYVCAQGKRPNPKPFLQQCEQTRRGQANPLLALLRASWEQYVKHRLDMASVVQHMEEIIDDRQLQEQQLQQNHQDASISVSDKERSFQVEGSVVSATTATVTESEHEDGLHMHGSSVMESPLHPHGSSALATSPAPQTPKPDRADENDEDDHESIHSLIVVDINIPGSRHSVLSQPSLEPTSGSDQSSRWDDSISTNEVGLMGPLGMDQSLSAIAFDEFLKPRHRGCAVESPQAQQQAAQQMSNGAILTAAAMASLAPPCLGTGTTSIGSSTRMAPPPPVLSRIVSAEFNEEDTEEEEVETQESKKPEAEEERGALEENEPVTAESS